MSSEELEKLIGDCTIYWERGNRQLQPEIRMCLLSEDGLGEQEGQFQDIFEEAAVGIAEVAPDGRFLRVNPWFCQVLGYTSQQLLQFRLQDLTHPDDRESQLGSVQALLDHLIERFSKVIRYIRPDRSVVWGKLTVSLVRDQGNNPKYLIAILTDINDLLGDNVPSCQQTEALHREREQRCQLALEGTGDSIWDWNLVSGKIYSDERWVRMLEEEPTAVNFDFEWWLNRLHPDSRSVFEQALKAYLEGRQKYYELEYRIPTKFGQWKWIRARGQCVAYDEQGQPLRMIGTHRDITERKQLQEALQESQERLNSILSSLDDVVWSLSTETNKLLYVNPAIETIYGRAVSEFFSQPNLWQLVVHPQDRERVEQVFQTLLEQGSKDIEYRIVRPDGEVRWIRDRARVITNTTGQPLRIDGILTDITERKQAENRLRRERDLLNGIMQTSVAAIAVVDPQGQIIFANERTEQVLGLTPSELVEREYNSPEWKITDFEGGPFPEEQLPFRQVMATGQPVFDVQHAIEWSDGTRKYLSINGAPLKDLSGTINRIVFCITDITDRKRVEEQLLHDALHDTLTGLPNRGLFMERVDHALKLAKRHKDYLFAVLFLDLDRFKVVNDSLGHKIGDQLLIAIARQLEECLRTTDTVARLGGDEFTILLEDINDIKDATRVAERIQQAIHTPFNLSGQEVFTTASIGIALSSTGYDRTEDLLRDADIAMYRAKELGKARHEVFDKVMHAHALELLRLENDLRRALERQEFEVYYQPITSLFTGTLTGFEALLRWRHPERGLVSPLEFIPVAEETGLIIPLGQWVLREACRQLRTWQTQFPMKDPLKISVNLSGKQLKELDLIAQIDQILEETGLDGSHLKLEITESVLMDNADTATKMLLQLRARNIQLSVDDFGTGYSSLSYLHRFPVNTLKIDRSFVSQMNPNDRNSEIVRTIVTLAHSLRMDVIAEGVETPEQLSALKILKCEQGQGYFFSKPLTKEAAGKLLAQVPQW